MTDVGQDNRFQDLLDDAWRLVSYTSRSGQASPNLMQAWIHAKHEFDASGSIDAALAPLLKEISVCLREIAPVRLADLGSPWHPFRSERLSNTKGTLDVIQFAVRKFVGGLFEFMFVAICVVVVIACGYYTLNYILLRDNIDHLTTLSSTDIIGKAEKFYVYYPDMTVDSVRSRKPPDNITADSFLQKSEELKNLDSQIGTYVTEGQSLLTSARNDPFHYAFSKIKGLLPHPKVATTLPADLLNVSRTPNYGPISPETPLKPAVGPPAKTGNSAAATVQNADNLVPAAAIKPGIAGTDDQHGGEALAAVQQENETRYFAQAGYTNIANTLSPVTTGVATVFLTINEEQEQIERYTMFFLPVLFGMLGTIVFQVRHITVDAIGKLAYWRLILRVLLGGLAGAGSSVLASGAGPVAEPHFKTGAGLLFLAFLLGFSLDLFFRILDRAVGVAGGWLDKSGAGKATTSVRPAEACL